MVYVECPSSNNPNFTIFSNNGLKPHNMHRVENGYRNEFQDILVQNRLPVFFVLESRGSAQAGECAGRGSAQAGECHHVCHHFSCV